MHQASKIYRIKIYRILLEIRCDDAGIIINYLFIYLDNTTSFSKCKIILQDKGNCLNPLLYSL